MFEEFFSNINQYIAQAPILAFAAVFLTGVLTSFTPCVYPVIPITVGYIGGRSVGSRRKGFLLSLSYVLGMALVYSALGVLAALTGTILGSLSAHPITLLVIANICLFLGLSMLEVLPIPGISLMPKSAGETKGIERKGIWGAFLVGMASGFIVSPCTAPVLAAVLIYVARQGNLIYGASLLFVFSLGMGLLLILIGTFSGLAASLPKSGQWLLRVKKTFGWFLLAVGEYFLIQMGKGLV